jgi:hypothetical protein
MTYGRRLYLLEAAGLQSFARPPLQAGQPPRVTFVTPALARASAIVENGELTRFDIDLIQPQGKEASLNADPTRTFGAARAQLHLIRRGGGFIDVALKIEGATIGEGYKPAFGGDLMLIELRGKLTQAQALDQLEAGAESAFDGIEHWRNAMGALEIDNLMLDWGPVKTNLKGSIGLDEAHEPSGKLAGLFDASEALGSFMRGNFSGAPQGQLALTLEFKDGDVDATASSAAAAPASAGAPGPAAP